jgi:hypothetical protein
MSSFMDAQAFEIVKILIDKGLLGGGLAIAAWLGAVALERHRSRNTLLVELHKRRADAVAEAWQAIFKFEMAISQAGFAYQDMHRNPKDQKAVLEANTRFREAGLAQHQAFIAISATRYWMGKDVSDDLTLLTNALTALLSAHNKGVGIEEARAELDKVSKEMSIEQALSRLTF